MEEKSLLRKKYKAIRDSLGEISRCLSEEICKNCAALPEFSLAETVLLYFAKGSEADLSCLAEAAMKMGKTVGYPRCRDRNTMTFHKVSGLSDLKKGRFGIMEPPENAPVCETEHAICFVPALAFDVEGYRIGYGGGYYDRFLSDFCGTAAGVAYEACLAERLVREEHDKKTDYIITESRVKKTIED